MLGILGLIGVALAGMILVPATHSASGDEADDSPETDEEPLPTIPLSELGGKDDDAHGSDDSGDTGMLGVEDNDPGVIPGPGPALSQNFEGDASDDRHIGTEGIDRLDGGDGDDELAGLGGDDELHGGAGNDALDGGAGDDMLYGHIGDDTLTGGAGNDSLNGGGGNDALDGGAGDDQMSGSFGNDILSGGAGRDVLMGGDGDDTLNGREDEAEADYLNGGAGDDWLIAGALDTVSGGEGADIFDLSSTQSGMTTIEDFDAGQDTLVLVYSGDGDAPVLSQSSGDDGVTILADGAPVAFLRGLADVDLTRIEQVAA